MMQLSNQSMQQSTQQETPSYHYLVGRTVHILDSNGIEQRFLIEDEPRPGLFEVCLERNRTIVTHIGINDLYWHGEDLYCRRRVSLKHMDDTFALTGLGTQMLVD